MNRAQKSVYLENTVWHIILENSENIVQDGVLQIRVRILTFTHRLLDTLMKP